MNPSFWAGRRVLVSGHTGFKGSWLCWWLVQMGAKPSGLSLDPPTQPNLFEASGLAREMASLKGDIRDADAFASAFRKERPEIVIHMAAQSLVRESYRDPAGTFATNVTGTAHCLEAARRADSVRAVLVVTTDKCYRNLDEGRPFVETDELGGADPYAASKACAELMTLAWRESFFTPGAGGPQSGAALVASARAGNVIGGGDWAADRLVPDAVRAFAAGQPLRVRNPAFTRPWQHVLEPLRGYLMLAERLCTGDRAAAGAFNFGPDTTDVRPVSWVADELTRRWDGAAWERDGGVHPHESALLSLDSGKAKAALGWRPVLGLEKALDWVVEWYRAFARGGDLRALTLEQVARYQELAA